MIEQSERLDIMYRKIMQNTGITNREAYILAEMIIDYLDGYRGGYTIAEMMSKAHLQQPQVSTAFRALWNQQLVIFEGKTRKLGGLEKVYSLNIHNVKKLMEEVCDKERKQMQVIEQVVADLNGLNTS